MEDYLRGQAQLALWGQQPIGLPPVVPAMPRPLALGLHCRAYNCLLVGGGLLEQPYRLWTYVQAALDAHDSYLALQARLNGPG